MRRELQKLLLALDQAGYICRQRGSCAEIEVGHGKHQPRPAIRLLVNSNLLYLSVRDRQAGRFERYPKDLLELIGTLVKTGHTIVQMEFIVDVISQSALAEEGALTVTIDGEGLRVSAISSQEKLVETLVALDVPVVQLAEEKQVGGWAWE